jgi:hypothetical protein
MPSYIKCNLVQALRLCTGHTANGGSRGIALPFLDHGTRRRWGVIVRPGRFLLPGKTRYPLYRRLGGRQGLSGQVRKISPPAGFDPHTVQPLASRYIDYGTRPTCYHICAFLYPVLPGVFHIKFLRFFWLLFPNPCFANPSFVFYLSRLSEKCSFGYKISILVLYLTQVPRKSVMLKFFNLLKTERLYYLRKIFRISHRRKSVCITRNNGLGLISF